jgi:hypothetical protein
LLDYNLFVNKFLQGIYGDYIGKVSQILRYYAIYDGDQKWETNADLDYKPTKKVTNLVKKLIRSRSRFMFGRFPVFDVRYVDGSEEIQKKVKEKEDLLYKIFEKNKFHSKLLKARKDCSIGGKIAIKLWADKTEGIKIIFSPAMEFFPFYDEDDVDELKKVLFIYGLNTDIETELEKQLIKIQIWEMVEDKCILNEGIYNGKAELIKEIYTDYNTGLDFIPVIVVINQGLTGETEGESDVKELWENQDAYNRLTSDDIDALKFQMFGQDVITDGAEESLKSIKIAPGAMIDLQTDPMQHEKGKQAKIERLESKFSYKDKFEDTVNRIKNDLYDTLDVPNIGLEQLKGLMQSGKSMRALYWNLIISCDEDWAEWGPALKKMVEYIFKMVSIYNLYDAKDLAELETELEIIYSYPINEDENEQKRVDIEEVVAQVRSKKAYMKKWGEYENIDKEIEQIQLERQMLEDNYLADMVDETEAGKEEAEEVEE